MPESDFFDSDELLYRQVHPSFVRDGRPSSQAFRPTPKDDGQLSVARGSLTSAEDAYDHHTGALGLASAGTWGITVGECQGQGLRARADPIASPPEKADPAHAVVDFSGVSKSQAEAKGARLARSAGSRGRLHPPDDAGLGEA
jgi:hypothetical protein